MNLLTYCKRDTEARLELRIPGSGLGSYPRRLALFALGEMGDEVALGKDADQAAILDDWKAADLLFDHEKRCVFQRRIRRGRDDVGRHDFFYG